MTKWRCGNCGYIWDGEAAPAVCPKCGAAKEKFEKLDDAAANLVERSRHTNCLHARLVAMAREIEQVCNEGIKDNLDAGCVDVFTKSRAHAWDMMKLSMTETMGHMKKNKWG